MYKSFFDPVLKFHSETKVAACCSFFTFHYYFLQKQLVMYKYFPLWTRSPANVYNYEWRTKKKLKAKRKEVEREKW
jgi:hypothetical protein